MDYQTRKVCIKGTNSMAVAGALAHLAGFPKGSWTGKASSAKEKSIIVYHKDLIDKIGGDISEAIIGSKPSITVTEDYRPPKGAEREWQPDGYTVEFDIDKVNPSLFGKLEKEIKSAYSNYVF